MAMSASGADLRSLMRRRRKSARSTAAEGFLSPANLLEERGLPRGTGVWTIGLCALTAVVAVWAAQTSLTEAVAARGVIRSTEPPQIVALPEGGQIAEWLAADGSRVEAGAPILRLNNDALSAAREALTVQRRVLALDDERLLALLEGRAPNFDTLAPANGAEISVQAALFAAQRSATEGRRAVLESRISIALSEIASHRRLRDDAERRSGSANEERHLYGRLSANGMLPRAQLIDIDWRHDRAMADIALHDAEIRRLDAVIKRARAQLAAFETTTRAELLTLRSEVLREAAAMDERLSSLTDRAETALILAGSDGILFHGQVGAAGAIPDTDAEIGQILPAGADLFVALSGAGIDMPMGGIVEFRVPGPDSAAVTRHRATMAQASLGGDTLIALNATKTLHQQHPELRPGLVLDMEILSKRETLLEKLFMPVRALMVYRS